MFLKCPMLYCNLSEVLNKKLLPHSRFDLYLKAFFFFLKVWKDVYATQTINRVNTYLTQGVLRNPKKNKSQNRRAKDVN